jgi:hypothetical protein
MRLDALAARSTDALDAPVSRPDSIRSVASYDTAGMGASVPMDAHAAATGYYEVRISDGSNRAAAISLTCRQRHARDQPSRVASPYNDSPAGSGLQTPYRDGSPAGAELSASSAFGAKPGQIFNASHPSYR